MITIVDVTNWPSRLTAVSLYSVIYPLTIYPYAIVLWEGYTVYTCTNPVFPFHLCNMENKPSSQVSVASAKPPPVSCPPAVSERSGSQAGWVAV